MNTMKNKNYKLLIVFVVLLIPFFLTSCGQKKVKNEEEHEEHGIKGVVILNEQQQKALNLQLGGFQMRNLTSVIKVNGQLQVSPSASADITAVIGGNVKKIMVFQGDKVRKGQVLAILEHPDYITLQEEFAEVANNLDFLKKEYERQKELYENNVGAGKDFQKAKSDYNTAKAKYEGLKARLKLLNLSPEKILQGQISSSINILSPINGYVNEVNIKLGSYVNAKDVLFELTDNTALHADFLVYEKDVHRVKLGQKVHFTVSNRPDKEYTATIFAIGKEFDTNTRAIHIHAQINESLDGLVPGMYISGHIHTDSITTQTLPNDAIVKEGTKSYIFVLDEEALKNEEHKREEGTKAFKMVEVMTGVKDDGYTEVILIDSLPENTKIVQNAAYYLLADMNKEETGEDH